MVSEIWNRRKETGGEGGLPKGEVSCRHPPQIPQRGLKFSHLMFPCNCPLKYLFYSQKLRN